jgi:DnaJ-class molecular chaperone
MGGGFEQHGFGGARRQARPPKGADIKATARISLEDIAEGKVQVRFAQGKTLSVSIPAGAEDGQVIRLKGQGEAGPAGNGDAMITLALKPHTQFRKEGDDLRIDLPVDLADAVLGGKIRVPTLKGAVSLKIPSWSNSDQTFRLKNKGLPSKNGGNGDLLVALRIQLPEKPDEKLIGMMEASRLVKS